MQAPLAAQLQEKQKEYWMVCVYSQDTHNKLNHLKLLIKEE